MKILHIIPSAFHYFDDIRTAAFGLSEDLHQLGIDVEAITIQYNYSVPASIKKQVSKVSPSQSYTGASSLDSVLQDFKKFDLIHLHCPIFGSLKKIIEWKKQHPDKPLLVTYYRPVKLTDFFSLVVLWYNKYYLKKLFAVANFITAYSRQIFYQQFGVGYLTDKMLEITDEPEFLGQALTPLANEVKLSAEQVVAIKFSLLYQELINEQINK